jgi:hypothetical protein
MLDNQEFEVGFTWVIRLTTEDALIKAPASFYVCIVTGEGRFTEIQVFTDTDSASMSITVTTWE